MPGRMSEYTCGCMPHRLSEQVSNRMPHRMVFSTERHKKKSNSMHPRCHIKKYQVEQQAQNMSDKIPEYMNMQGKRKIARQNVIVKKVKTHKTHVNIKKIYVTEKFRIYVRQDARNNARMNA